jgi:predicted ATP-dependent protease
MTDEDREAAGKAFVEVVNMSPAELEKWLETDDSQAVGWTHEGEGEAVGHQSGRRIVEIKRKKKTALTDADYAHMRKVVGYVHRHMAQGGPAEDKAHSKWRYSLMNWGYDPLK